MVERASALDGHHKIGRFGADGDPGVTLCEVRDLTLWQVAAWPDTLGVVSEKAAAAAATNGMLLHIEPLKWWLVGAQAPELQADQGAVLDLSHSRTHVKIFGPEATTLLNRHLPLDFRDASFPAGSVASTAFHHVGVTLWRSGDGYELLLPRGFAASLWQMLLESAAQFGCEIE